ncbi:MAG: SpoIIE family protein phosphatase [Vicinamibacterales bacterium]|nr:SpoIIE family protein phosphatase [Vicinamibacterales bacterium]
MPDAPRWSLATLPLLEAAPDAVVVVDGTGTVVYANPLIEQVFGYAPDAVIGQPVELLLPEDGRTIHRQHRHAYGASRQTRQMGPDIDPSGRHQSGREIPLDIGLSPIETDDGPLVIAVVRDISEHRRVENDLRRLNIRLNRDFDAAAHIQTSLLPDRPARIPGITVDWLFDPCARLGGDSFNIFMIGDRFAGFYLLDVTGHGVVAALQSVALTRVLAAAWPTSVMSSIRTPAKVTQRLNEQFPINPAVWQYFTFLCGVMDLTTNTVRYASAGHPGPVHIPANGDPVILEAAGLPIGMFPDADYDEFVVTLGGGDRLYFYSDGVTDALNQADEDFGRERLMETLDATQTLPLAGTLRDLRAAVSRWRGTDRLDDDLTMLAIEVPARRGART